jgi:hypothetical protein
VHSGSLGGPHTGTVLNGGLTYTQLRTATGLLQLPNAGLLAAAITPTAAIIPTAGADTTSPAPDENPPRADNPA